MPPCAGTPSLSPARFPLLLRAQEPPPHGPSSRRGRAYGLRLQRSLPSAALAAPEIKIKCGLGRGSGVGEAAGSSSGSSALGFILSVVTSPPNLWHFNYVSYPLALPGPEYELTLSCPGEGWPQPGPQPRPAPGKPVGPCPGLPPPAAAAPGEPARAPPASSLAPKVPSESLCLHTLLRVTVATVSRRG